MSDPRIISLDSVSKSDVAVCPKCGTVFVKTVKGITRGFLRRTGVYCPVCDSLAIKWSKGSER